MREFKENCKKYLGVLLVSLIVAYTISGCAQSGSIARNSNEETAIEISAGAGRVVE